MSISESKSQELIQGFIKEIKKIIPSFEFFYSSGTSVNEIVKSIELQLRVSQNLFHSSLSNWEPTREIIHYTSIDSLFNILHTSKLRLYDLNYSNDPQEYSNTLKRCGINLSENKIEEIKSSIFTSSFCKYLSKSDESLNMWRLYGYNGNGVGLVFEVKNEKDDWNEYLLKNVIYQDVNADLLIQQLYKLIDEYSQKVLQLQDTPMVIELIVSFFKDAIWHFENEIRLSTHYKYDINDYTPNDMYSSEKHIYECLSKSGTRSAYIELPLYENSNENTHNKIQLQLKEVIIGYNVNHTQAELIKDIVLKYSMLKYNRYVISIDSRFRNYFQKN